MLRELMIREVSQDGSVNIKESQVNGKETETFSQRKGCGH